MFRNRDRKRDRKRCQEDFSGLFAASACTQSAETGASRADSRRDRQSRLQWHALAVPCTNLTNAPHDLRKFFLTPFCLFLSRVLDQVRHGGLSLLVDRLAGAGFQAARHVVRKNEAHETIRGFSNSAANKTTTASPFVREPIPTLLQAANDGNLTLAALVVRE